jgi:hypothetical protein
MQRRKNKHLAEGEDEPVERDLDAKQHEQAAEEEVGHEGHQAERDGEQRKLGPCAWACATHTPANQNMLKET